VPVQVELHLQLEEATQVALRLRSRLQATQVALRLWSHLQPLVATLEQDLALLVEPLVLLVEPPGQQQQDQASQQEQVYRQTLSLQEVRTSFWVQVVEGEGHSLSVPLHLLRNQEGHHHLHHWQPAMAWPVVVQEQARCHHLASMQCMNQAFQFLSYP
jgi:hypothetical protein